MVPHEEGALICALDAVTRRTTDTVSTVTLRLIRRARPGKGELTCWLGLFAIGVALLVAMALDG
jgi:hypothetical protein